MIGKKPKAYLYLQENKTKADINEQQLHRQLQFDLQTMFYLVALWENKASPKGVRYNVVRRPLSGGKGSIRQHKPSKAKPQGESLEEFYSRLGGIIAEDPGYYFMRWTVGVTKDDIERFKREFLNPILESLCDWWEWIKGGENPWIGNCWRADKTSKRPAASRIRQTIHYRTPYGFYNVLAEGGSTELDEYLATGSMLGLEQKDKLFGELD